MRPWLPTLALLAACAPPPDGSGDTDDTAVDTDGPDDTDDTDAAETDVPDDGPVDVVVAQGRDALDPELLADPALVVWQDPRTSVAWLAEILPSGQWRPADGAGLELGQAVPMQGTATAPATYNGPEWGERGAAVYFTQADDEGFNAVARYARGSGAAVRLSGGDGVHRSGAIPQLWPAGDRTAVLYFRGELADVDLAWRWIDEAVDRPFPGVGSIDPTPRWIPGEDAIAVLVEDDDGWAQVGRYDLAGDTVVPLTSDEGHKADPFLTADPAGGRVLTAAVADTLPDRLEDLVPSRIAVYREGPDGFARERTIGVEDLVGGGPYAHTSVEPFVADGRVWVSFVATPSTSRSDPTHVFVASVDGADLVQVTEGTLTRADPEVVVIGGEALLVYTERRGGRSNRLHVVRGFLP